MKAVILAAGVGSRLQPMTDDRPKALVEVGGIPLLFRTMDRLAAVGITGRDAIVVAGYRMDVLERTLERAGRPVTIVENPRFEAWNNFWSLYVAREAVGDGDFLQIDGDVLFDEQVLPRMLASPGPGALSIDVRPELDPETMKVTATEGGWIKSIAKSLDPAASIGEYVGVTRIDRTLAPRVFEDLARFEREGLTHEYYEHAYHRLSQQGEAFRVVNVAGCEVMEIDDGADLRRANAMVQRAQTGVRAQV